MLKLYYYLQSKIQSTELKLSGRIEKKITEPYNSNLFYFNLVALNLLLVFLQITTDLFKFIIILTRDPGISFNIFFKQRELRSCPYSYSYYKTVQSKIKLFSFAGASTIVFVTVVASLITNLMFGGKLPGSAATYGWLQNDWSGGASTTATLAHAGMDNVQNSGWSKFFSMDNYLSASTDSLTLGTVTSSTVQTTNADFSTSSATSQIQVVGADIAGKIQLQPVAGLFGSGADGSLTISTTTTKNINTQTNGNGGRTCADGISYNATGLSTTTATLSTTPVAGCLATGDKVLLINLQGANITETNNTGNYEFLEVASVTSNKVTFTYAKTKLYGNNGADTNIGTTTTNQRVVLQRVPQYSNVTIQSGGILTANAWNGVTGGVVAFYASGTVAVQAGGKIDMTGRGYRGGDENFNSYSSRKGESYGGGFGTEGASANLGGGGASYCFYDEWCWGGGGYALPGSTLSGSYGVAYGGGMYGTPDLSRIFLGSGGGSAGGGIAYIGSKEITVGGSVENKGDSGGGSGGSIYIFSNNINSSAGVVTAEGGAYGEGEPENDMWMEHGSGGIGRIYIQSNTISGTTTPLAVTSPIISSYKFQGSYTSPVLTLPTFMAYTDLVANLNLPANTSISLDLRVGDDSVPDDGSGDWTGWQADVVNQAGGGAVVSTTSIAGLDLSKRRYFQYKINLATTDNTVTPSFEQLSINYNSYATDQSLISTPYNSLASENLLGSILWKEDETLPSGAGVTLSLRAASTSDLLAASTWHVFSNASAGCQKTANQVACDSAVLKALTDNELGDGINEQWFQYKATLNSDGAETPTLTEVQLFYVVNAPPELQITEPVSQGADGKVNVSYQVRDIDSSTGRTPGSVNLSLQYCTANCTATGTETWATAQTVTGQFSTTTVNVSAPTEYTSYVLVWDPKIDFAGNYFPNDFKIRLSADDAEAANNMGYGVSNLFTLDTANPVSGTNPLLIDASANPAVLTLNVTDDDPALEMQPSLEATPNLAGSWLPYNATTTLALVTNPDTAYVHLRDTRSNYATVSIATPEMPTSMVIRDLTSSSVDSFMEFTVWKVVATPSAGFKQYNVWRGEGTDTVPPGSYLLLDTIASSSRNYYLDNTVVTGTTYYYKISTEDNNGNISYFSQVVKDSPDGQGGTDNTPPTIKQVEVVATSTQSATIEWDTDELSDSLIGYSLNESDFSDMLGIDTMVNYSTTTAIIHGYDAQAANGRHRVTLSGLMPGTTYYFKVKSADPQGNYAEDTNGGDGFSFETRPGPRMQLGPIVTSVNNQTATINWQTNILANATVVYATGTDFMVPSYASTTEFTTSQQVIIDNLLANTKYYYYIKNQDESGNESVIKKVENGIESYYDFTTTNDTNPPSIEDVTCSMLSDTSLSIKWKTTSVNAGKPATARVDYGRQSGAYASSTETTIDYNTDHTVGLASLIASSTYYFQVVSTDINGNTATSSEYSCGTSEELVTKTESDKLVQDAKVTAKTEGKAEGVTEGKANAGGGGTIVIDKTDKTAPAISNIAVSELKADSAVISWRTDEVADSFVEFGVGGMIKYFGKVVLTNSHQATLENLIPESKYGYKVKSKDSSGNLATGADLSFTTPSLVEQLTEEGKTIDEINKMTANSADKTATNEKTLIAAAQKAMELVAKVAGNVSLGTLETTLFSQYDTIEKLANALPAPVMGGEPGVVTTATTATIAWRTDKDANSLVAYVPDQVYNLTKNDSAYQQVVGESNDKTTAHLVKISGLKPETVYHYQLRSKADLGPEGKSRDFTFTTKPETLEISNYAIQNISDQKATFRWVTNIETDSSLSYVPYRNNKLAVDEVKIVANKSLTTIHEITVDGFESGAIYQVELSGKDAKGNLAEKTIETYSTSKDDLPPVISQVQTESALSQGKSLKVQTVISWMTNEPTIGQVTYEKGVVPGEKEFANKTPVETAYGKKHVMVITKFDPGAVYSFRVSATDSANNKVTSKTFTMLTPKQKESVFQLILKNFEQTFGWVGKMNQ